MSRRRTRRDGHRCCSVRRMGLESLEARRLLAATVADQFVVAANSASYSHGGTFSHHSLLPSVEGNDGVERVDLSQNDSRLTFVDSSTPQREMDLFNLSLGGRLDTGADYLGTRIKVDPSESYRLTTDAIHLDRYDNFDIGYRPYDVDGNRIVPSHVSRFPGSVETVLLQDLSPCFTEIVVADASGWSTDPFLPASTRALAVFGYENASGGVYDDYSYTRRVAGDDALGAWNADAITYDAALGGYRITLNEPWHHGFAAAGTAVRNTVLDEGSFEVEFETAGTATQSDRRGLYGRSYSHQNRAVSVKLSGTQVDPESSRVTGFVPGASEIEFVSNHSLSNASFRFTSDDSQSAAEVATFDGDSRVVAIESLQLLESDLEYPVSTGTSYQLRATAHWLGGFEYETHSIGFTAYDSNGQMLPTVDGNSIHPVLLNEGFLSSYPQVLKSEMGVAFPVGTSSIRLAALVNQSQLNADEAVVLQNFSITANKFEEVAPSSNDQYVLSLDVLANDDDSASLSITEYSDPVFGTVSLVGDEFQYTAPPFFVGTDTFTYTVYNVDAGEFQTEVVTVEILGTPLDSNPAIAAQLDEVVSGVLPALPPVGMDDITARRATYDVISGAMFVVDGNAQTTLLFNDVSDLSEQDYIDTGDWYSDRGKTVWLLDGPGKGSLSLAAEGSFQYVSDDGFVGTDTFQYAIFDGVRIDTATVTINVIPDGDSVSQRRLSAIVSATHDYHSAYKTLPILRAFNPPPERQYHDENGVAYLSWRVHLLPFLGFSELYGQFALNEPYDSATNLPLLDQMPDVFRSGGQSEDDFTTRFQRLLQWEPWQEGPHNISGGNLEQTLKFRDFLDGLTHTIMYVETGLDKAVPWTANEDTFFDIGDPLATLGQVDTGHVHIAMSSGNIVRMPMSVSPDDFLSLSTRSGGRLADPSVVDVLALERQWIEDEYGVDVADEYTAARFAQDQQSLAGGLLNFHSAYTLFPPFVRSNTTFPDTQDENGKPTLSWRVSLLPFIDYQDLYNRFDFDQPWDSPHNLALAAEMPDVYRSVGDPADSTLTRIQVLDAPGTVFGAELDGTFRRGRLRDIRDGYRDTILLAEAGVDQAVLWTKPEDISFQWDDPVASLGDYGPTGQINLVMADGSLLSLKSDIDDQTFSDLATQASRKGIDGAWVETTELVDASSLGRRFEAINEIDMLEHSSDGMKLIMLGMHDFHSAYKRLPVLPESGFFDENGSPFLSWRVHLLPFLGKYELFSQFNLDEPWDSPNNLPLLAEMPDFYRAVGDGWDSTQTRIQGVVSDPDVLVLGGSATAFGATHPNDTGPYEGRRFRDMLDGVSNAVYLVETGPDQAIPWTKPDDVRFDPSDPVGAFGSIGDSFLVGMADGATMRLPGDIDDHVLRQLLLIADGGNDLYQIAPAAIDLVLDQGELARIDLRREDLHSDYLTGDVVVEVADPNMIHVSHTSLGDDPSRLNFPVLTVMAVHNPAVTEIQSTTVTIGDQVYNVTVHPVVSPSPGEIPNVQSIVINEGDDQRSTVSKVTVRFDSIVDHDKIQDAVMIVDRESGQVTPVMVNASDSSGQTSIDLTFPAVGGSLSDGNHQLYLNRIHVIHALTGNQMASHDEFGDRPEDRFFQLFGDRDGDRDVDGLDLGGFGQAFLSVAGQAKYNVAFDGDLDGDVDGLDLGRFGQRFLTTLPF